MDRIKESQLQALCEQINVATNSPQVPYTKIDGNKLRANVGNYHLSCQYGGVSFLQMANGDGGVKTIFDTTTKRDLYNQMRAFLSGLNFKN
jgi:hypothetical protein